MEDAMDMPLTGSCQCGSVTYEITGAPLALYTCHCTDCQKQSASAFGLSLRVRTEDFVITGGQLSEFAQMADSGRQKIGAFCADCGCRIYHAPAAGGPMRIIKAGTLDDTSWFNPVAHMWVRSRQPWVAIPTDRLVYETQPDDFAPVFEAWQARQRPD